MTVDEIIRAIEELPEADGRRLRSRLARQALDEEAFVSAHERARHLIGSVDGPSDLSSNKAYLDSTGERSLS